MKKGDESRQRRHKKARSSEMKPHAHLSVLSPGYRTLLAGSEDRNGLGEAFPRPPRGHSEATAATAHRGEAFMKGP